MTGRTLLVVDDDPAIRLILVQNLKLEGYEVKEAIDGGEALDLIAAEPPDLIILDVMLPVLDGFEVLERLRSKPATAELPVIMLTALSSTEEIWAGWNKGVDYYMTKPFDIEEIIRFIDYIFNEIDQSLRKPQA